MQGKLPCITFGMSENSPTNGKQLASTVSNGRSTGSKFLFAQYAIQKSTEENMIVLNCQNWHMGNWGLAPYPTQAQEEWGASPGQNHEKTL
jgi:hypothetical protein